MSLVSRYLEPTLIERLNHLQLSARSVVAGSTIGSHRSPVKGASIEFRQHRFYVPGDEPRRIDWRLFGRTDRPYVKEYDEETNLRCAILIDCSGSMAYQSDAPGRLSKFEYAASIAAALSYLMLGQTETVGLGLFRKRIDHWLAPKSGTAQLANVIDSLERAAPRGECSLPRALNDAGNRLDRRSLVIVISDFFTSPTKLHDGIARLKHDRHEIIALRVLDRDELEFPFRTWTRFRGLEGEEPKLCEPAVIRRAYLDNFNRHREQLEAECRASRIEYQTFVTHQPLPERLVAFLLHRAGLSKPDANDPKSSEPK